MGVQKPSDIIGLSLSKTKAKFKDEKKNGKWKKEEKKFHFGVEVGASQNLFEKNTCIDSNWGWNASEVLA